MIPKNDRGQRQRCRRPRRSMHPAMAERPFAAPPCTRSINRPSPCDCCPLAERFQEICRNHRRHQPRNREAHQHRDNDHGQAEVLEILPRDARASAPTGRNTATIDMVVAEHRQPNLVGSVDRLPDTPLLPMRMWRTMFSISTMASSTSTPATRLSASSVIWLSVKPSRSMHPEGGDRRHRDRQRRDDRRSPVAQEDEHDRSTARIAPSTIASIALDSYCMLGVLHRCSSISLNVDLRDASSWRALPAWPSARRANTATSDPDPLARWKSKLIDLPPVQRRRRMSLLGIEIADLRRCRPACTVRPPPTRNLRLPQLKRRPWRCPARAPPARSRRFRSRPPAAFRFTCIEAQLVVDLARGQALRLHLHADRGSRGSAAIEPRRCAFHLAAMPGTDEQRLGHVELSIYQLSCSIGHVD